MAGAVVLGIFALVYVQMAQNRANFSQITSLMSFRDQVITYYGNVVANRGTWECTVRANSSLGSYFATGRVPPRLTTGPDTTTKGVNLPDGTLEIRDYSGDCQAEFGGATDGKKLIAAYREHADGTVSGGLGLNLQDYNDLPIYYDNSNLPPPTPGSPLRPNRACDNSEDGTHFCLRVEWEGLAPDQGSYIHSSNRAAEIKLVLVANRKAIKKQLGVNFTLRDKEHHIYMRRTIATDCGGKRPPNAGVSSYAGDYAVHVLDLRMGRVDCDIEKGPLAVPPCYDVTDTTSNNPFRSNTGVTWDRSRGFGDLTSQVGLRCDGRGRTTRSAIKGSCPRTSGGGTTAIAYFDPRTGIAQCSHPNILVEKVVVSDTAKHCSGNNRFGVVRIGNTGVFQCSTGRWGTSRGGVKPEGCSGTDAIRGFRNSGAAHCVQRNTAMPGLSGPQGERGISGQDRYNQHRSTGRVYMGRDSHGRTIYRYNQPSGPTTSGPNRPWQYGGGVGPRGGAGTDRTCGGSCFTCYPYYRYRNTTYYTRCPRS